MSKRENLRVRVIEMIENGSHSTDLGPVVANFLGKKVYANQLLRKNNFKWEGGRYSVSDGADTNGESESLRKFTPNTDQIIIYWSRSGSTEFLASKIENLTDADVYQITLKNPYPSNYLASRSRANSERATNNSPEIIEDMPDLKQYLKVYFGFQTWAMELSEPIKSFLKVYGNCLSNKEILPFETQGGFGIGSCINDIDSFLKQAGAHDYQIKSALVVNGNRVDEADAAVKSWLKEVNV